MFDNGIINLLIGDFSNSLSLPINTYKFYEIVFNFKVPFASDLTLASSTALWTPTEGAVPKNDLLQYFSHTLFLGL